MASETIVTQATLTCPSCGHAEPERMPEDACLFFWTCPGCGTRHRPAPGDCCVFCSYADVPCPPVQREGTAGCCGIAGA